MLFDPLPEMNRIAVICLMNFVCIVLCFFFSRATDDVVLAKFSAGATLHKANLHVKTAFIEKCLESDPSQV